MPPDLISQVTQGGAIAVLLLGFAGIIRGDFRTKQEVLQLQQQVKDLQAEKITDAASHEAEKEILRKEVRDWQERVWDRLNEFAKPAIQALKERQPK